MLSEVFYLILGFIFLISGANLLVKGASNVAKRFNIPEILIGLTIVALGTSAPELIVTITSGIKGAGELIIGNAIGSNICNLLLVLGLIAIIKPIEIDEQAKNIHIPVSLFVTILVLLMGLSSTIDRTEGIVLLLLFVLYFCYPIIKQINNVRARIYPHLNEKLNKKDVGATIGRSQQKKRIFIQIVYILMGITLLKYGGDFVVDNSINIAKILNISEDIIGLTIIAFGTSLPELVTSIVATIKGEEDIAVGNIMGSCIFNLLLILGVGAIIIPLNISRDFISNLFILIISTLIIWGYNFVGKKNYITRLKGVGLLTIFALYIVSIALN